MLCRNGYEADVVSSAKEALLHIGGSACHVIVADVDRTGDVKLLKKIKDNPLSPGIIAITSSAERMPELHKINIDQLNCFLKPAEDDVIVSAIEKIVNNKPKVEHKPSLIQKLLHIEETFHGLVGKSPLMKDIYSLVNRISDSKATVLLRGESGTGKRLIAHAIHKADKKRRDKPFVEIACGALPREIIESELFGHTKGSFTGAISDRKGRFELAHGGTILLDDIDSFSLDIQVKLLRVLQHKEFERVGDHKTVKVDVRIIVATNQDLEKAVAEKRFREDLYYRLNVISINIPPLRKRKDDLPFLAEHFFRKFSKENHKKLKPISPDVLNVLMSYDWPGNIRELENLMERAVILDTDAQIGLDDLPEIIFAGTKTYAVDMPETDEVVDPRTLKNALKEPEKVYILKVLEEVGGNKKKAAQKLGVNRTTLYNKLKKYQIS